ncbi:uncharacterized protein J3R85_002333 [Psidium guajava]|nr:uncharacterized protein J3R85_002333 [Psidium guajava]
MLIPRGQSRAQSRGHSIAPPLVNAEASLRHTSGPAKPVSPQLNALDLVRRVNDAAL